jgi:hypothetical protein
MRRREFIAVLGGVAATWADRGARAAVHSDSKDRRVAGAGRTIWKDSGSSRRSGSGSRFSAGPKAATSGQIIAGWSVISIAIRTIAKEVVEQQPEVIFVESTLGVAALSSSVSSLNTMPAFEPASSFASFALRSTSGSARRILAVELQQVKHMEDRVGHRAPSVERFEHGDAVGSGHSSLAVQGERLGAQLGGHRSDLGIAIGPVKAAAGEQVHGRTVPAHDQPISVVLNLVHPAGPGRRLGGNGRDAGGDKSVSPDEGSGHAGEIAVC